MKRTHDDTSWNLKVKVVTPVPLNINKALRLISTRSCRIAVPLHCEREGTEITPLFALAPVHYNISFLVI